MKDDRRTGRDLALPVSAEMLVPHRRPMCMVDHLVESTDASGVVEAFIGADSPLVADDGALDSIAFMELLAQSFAAIKGYRDLLQEKPPQKGFLVSAKHMEFKGRAFLGDRLRISVSTAGEVGGFTIAEGTVTRGDELLASGTLTLWIPGT